MSHDTHTESSLNREIEHARSLGYGELKAARDYYLTLADGWTDPFPDPVVEMHDGFAVVRDDLLDVGSKARFGDLLVSRAPRGKTLVYVAPRFGFAGISLAYLARRHKRRLVLFMPSCKRISDHQAVAIEMGAEPKFARIAAMPNLNKIAAEWAASNNGYFIPLGLKHELVTAAIVATAYRMSDNWAQSEGVLNPDLGNPCEVWTAISTGVLSRALQIAWPYSKFRAVAVSRNIHEGERGHAKLFSSPLEFAQDARSMPPFPSASNYDAKVWDFMVQKGQPGALFWNVAGNIGPDCSHTFGVNSARDWGDTNY